MKRWLPLGLFLLAVLVFFVSGRVESANRATNKQIYSPQMHFPHSEEHHSVAPGGQSGSSSATAQAAAFMPIIITLVFGVLALWMVVSKSVANDDERRKWALGTLGVIIGYWLKG